MYATFRLPSGLRITPIVAENGELMCSFLEPGDGDEGEAREIMALSSSQVMEVLTAAPGDLLSVVAEAARVVLTPEDQRELGRLWAFGLAVLDAFEDYFAGGWGVVVSREVWRLPPAVATG